MSLWPMVPMGEVLTQVERKELVDATREYKLLGVRLEGRGPFLREAVIGAQSAATKLARVESNDFIYSRLFAWRGAFGVIGEDLAGCYVSNEFPVFVTRKDRLDVRFLNLWFRLKPTINAVAQNCTGSTPLTRNRFKEEFFNALQIPLPPLTEQRRLVERIEALAAKIEEASGLREEAENCMKALTVSERNRIFTELSRITPPRVMSQVAQSRLGKMVSGNRADEEQGVPYLRNANIRWDRLDLSSVYRIIVSEKERIELSLQPGDILTCEGRHLGKSAIWNGEIAGCIFQKALHRIRVDRSQALPRFLLHHMFWSAKRGDFNIHSESTIPHLTGVMLKRHIVFVPSLPEQERIVNHLDTLQAKEHCQYSLQLESAGALNSLLPAILDRAFNGEL